MKRSGGPSPEAWAGAEVRGVRGGLAPRGTVHIPCVRVSTFIKAAIRRCNPTLENSEKCLLAGARGFYLPHWEGFPR